MYSKSLIPWNLDFKYRHIGDWFLDKVLSCYCKEESVLFISLLYKQTSYKISALTLCGGQWMHHSIFKCSNYKSFTSLQWHLLEFSEKTHTHTHTHTHIYIKSVTMEKIFNTQEGRNTTR